MSEEKLPKGWKIISLGKALSLEYGKSLPKKDRSGSGYPVMGSNGVIDEHFEYLIEGPGIIVGRKGSHGEVVWVDENFYPIDTTYFVIPKPTVELRFAYYFLKKSDLKSLNRSTAIPGLNRTDAYNLEFPLPPLPEQQRIVAKLDALFGHLDRLREKLDRIPELLKNFRQQVLTQAVTGELTRDIKLSEEVYFKFYGDLENQRRIHWEKVEEETILKKGGIPKKDWKKRYVIPNRSDSKNLEEFPKDWKQKSLEYWADVIDPNPRHRNPQYVEKGIPFLSTAQFGNLDGWDFKNINYVSEETVVEQEDRCKFRKGSIAFSRKGTIGKTRLLPNDIRFALLDSLCVINSNPLIDSVFLNICLRSEPVQKQIAELTRGVALKQVSLGAVRSLLIPVPPVQIQEKIVSRVIYITSIADKIESQYQSLKSKIDNLPQAILAKAFRGELVGQEVKEYVREVGEVLMAAEGVENYGDE